MKQSACASIELAHQPPMSQYEIAECDQCGRTFGSVQALNARHGFVGGMWRISGVPALGFLKIVL